MKNICKDTWDNPGQAYDNGPNYSFNLLLDYEEYMESYGFTTIVEFLKGWTCINRYSFENLQIDDIIYDATGCQYKVVGEVIWDDYNIPYVDAKQIYADREESSYAQAIHAGDAYYDSKVHTDYHYKRKTFRQGDEPICPILITKTNQPQN